MRFLAFSLIMFVSLVEIAVGQTPAPKATEVIKFPMYRPVLLGTGPTALINRIDTQDLINKGQKDAAVMFSCSVKKTGDVVWSGIYRGTADSKLLQQELQKWLAPATQPKFIPGVYNHQPVDAIYYGTVTFAVIKGKARLRIFSNQETAELEKETDFVGPQPFFGDQTKFTGLHYPVDSPVRVDGVVELLLKIDADGNLQDIQVGAEKPPFLGFADAAVGDFQKAKFIPAFRDGRPVACAVTLPVYYNENF